MHNKKMLLLPKKNKGSKGGGFALLKRLAVTQGFKGDNISTYAFDNYYKSDKTGFNKSSIKLIKEDMVNLIRVNRPDVIVISDSNVSKALLGMEKSNEVTRGSVIFYKGIPCVLTLDGNQTKFTSKARMGEGSTRTELSPEIVSAYIAYDMRKAHTFAHGAQTVFEHKGKICKEPQDVIDILAYAKQSKLCAIDIETSISITSIAFSYLLYNEDGSPYIRSFCVPFINPQNENGEHWKTIEDERLVWDVVKKLCEDHTDKIFHNGSFDCSWLIKYGIIPNNFYWDTMHMMHSFAPLMRKSLAHVASIFCDDYIYWKDEIKGAEKSKKKTAVPKTLTGIHLYWKYNMKDTYYTLMSFLGLSYLLERYDYASDNYLQEITMQYGVANPISYYGMVKDKEILLRYLGNKRGEVKLLAENGNRIFSSTGISPNGQEVKDFIFSAVLKNWEKRPSPSLDAKVCARIKEEYPFASLWLDHLDNWKKTEKIISTFENYAKSDLNKIYTSLGCNPWTGRFSSSKNNHAPNSSGNIQNINKKQKIFFSVPKEHFLVEIDYSQSDNYFVAHACGDEKMIEVVNNPSIDTHIYHASFFFGVPYDELYRRIKEGDQEAILMRVGTKPVTHGAHYGRHGTSLIKDIYMGIGKARKIATRRGLDGEKMTERELSSMLTKMMDEYKTVLYPKLNQWFETIGEETAKNNNIIKCFGGRWMRFHGDSANSATIKRQIAAFYGQGGTGGNINRAMRMLINDKLLFNSGVRLINTVHDSIIFQVPVKSYEMINRIKDIMEQECVWNNYKFKVPVDISIGILWGDLDDYDINKNPIELYQNFVHRRQNLVHNLTINGE